MKMKKVWAKLRFRLFTGKGEKLSVLQMVLIYSVLIGMSYVFLYPLLYMISLSMMSVEDLVNPTVLWIPNKLSLQNYEKAWKVLHLPDSFMISLLISGACAILQTMTCAITAYGLERFDVPGQKILFGLIGLTFIVPSQVTLIPKSLMFFTYGMKNTVYPSLIPAFLGQGLKSAVFILLFYQSFHSNPRAMDEAAQIDGAGRFKTFWRIALPMCSSVIVVSFLFSFVWYWNETYQAGIFYGEVIKTLPMRLMGFVNEFASQNPAVNGDAGNRLNEGIRMAGTFLTILPLMVLYAFLQRRFIEGVERTGITGE